MRRRLLTLALSTLLCASAAAEAQVSFGIQAPGVSIGVNLPVYPTLVRVPNYPVYYDPQVSANYFFYDGLFWVYSGDTWYSSTWYDGPWQPVAPDYVPYFVLRIPVRYYREPPPYFHGWSSDAPPHWGEHWGHDWESHRAGWDQWNRNSVPAPAPLPVYQKQYSGDRYPHAPAQQQALRTQNYHYQPRETVTRQAFQQQGKPAPSQAAAPAHAATPAAPHAPTHTAQPRQRQPETTAATRAPSPNVESAQVEHTKPQPHQQAAQQRPPRAAQVAHQPEPAQSQVGRTAQASKATEHAPPQQHAQKAPPPAREAQAAHETAGAPQNRAAAPAHPAQTQAKAAPKESHPAQGNGQARQEHEEKASPQQQGNVDKTNEQHG
ncbi:MAG TPA: hypothetical protein VIH36_08720 [Casimicrobiaceae bacterium]|jgi:hypothetical protein